MEKRIITFEELQKANETILTTDIKGKNYAEVNQRIKAFRMVYPQGVINTLMVSNENGVCIFRAEVLDEYGHLLASGTAYEKENSTFINKTSYIENCETSAVGRALGIAGFGIDTSVASAEEVENAINNQVEEVTQEMAEEYVISFGKYEGRLLKEICEEDDRYTNWLFESIKTDPVIKKCITLLTGKVEISEEEEKEILTYMSEINTLVALTGADFEEILKHYQVKSTANMTLEQLKDCKAVLEKKKEKEGK